MIFPPTPVDANKSNQPKYVPSTQLSLAYNVNLVS